MRGSWWSSRWETRSRVPSRFSLTAPIACLLTSGSGLTEICDLVLACRHDMTRPPLDHLRIPCIDPGGEGGGRGVQYGVARERSRAAAGRWSGTGPAGVLPPGAVRVLHGPGGCAVRAGGRGAVRRWAGEDPGGVVAGAGAPARPWRLV